MAYYMQVIKQSPLNQGKGVMQEYTWYVNQDKPTLPPMCVITLLQADGDELDHIKSVMLNIPYTSSTCKWRGELAIFVYDNLPAIITFVEPKI